MKAIAVLIVLIAGQPAVQMPMASMNECVLAARSWQVGSNAAAGCAWHYEKNEAKELPQ